MVFILGVLTPVVVSSLPLDCHDIYKANNWATSGVYTIYPVDDDTPVKVYCDMDTDGGKWTVRILYYLTGCLYLYFTAMWSYIMQKRLSE